MGWRVPISSSCQALKCGALGLHRTDSPRMHSTREDDMASRASRGSLPGPVMTRALATAGIVETGFGSSIAAVSSMGSLVEPDALAGASGQ
eukprot:scaffold21737_cov40-Prasinocladus_malaysianus.AAC.1